MAGKLTDAQKKTAVLVELVKSGVVDLNSMADQLVQKLPADFDPSAPPQLGGMSAGTFVGRWFVLGGGVED